MAKISITDAVLFITGANRERGIGHALVEEAISRGAKKVYATSRNTSQLKSLVSHYPNKVVPVELDVTDKKQIQAACEIAQDAEILINNSGVAAYSGAVENYDEKACRQEIEVNFFGPLHVAHAFLPNGHLKAIVNILSIASLYSFAPAATYSASKAASYSMTRALRAELASKGVSVFGAYPGPIDTDMAADIQMPKETPKNVAIRIFDGMEKGMEDITTDAFADMFKPFLDVPPEVTKALG